VWGERWAPTYRRPKLRVTDRLFWIELARVWTGWKHALLIVAADTVLLWQRRRRLVEDRQRGDAGVRVFFSPEPGKAGDDSASIETMAQAIPVSARRARRVARQRALCRGGQRNPPVISVSPVIQPASSEARKTLVEVLLRDILERRELVDARVVDQDV